jgi:hypothetical protein
MGQDIQVSILDFYPLATSQMKCKSLLRSLHTGRHFGLNYFWSSAVNRFLSIPDQVWLPRGLLTIRHTTPAEYHPTREENLTATKPRRNHLRSIYTWDSWGSPLTGSMSKPIVFYALESVG